MSGESGDYVQDLRPGNGLEDGDKDERSQFMEEIDAILKMLEDTLVKTTKWLISDKENYHQKVVGEGKELCDKSVEELDQNLRKQWPRKGRLEVEVF